MSNNKYDHEAELKAAKRAEIERIWFAQEATNKELLDAYKGEADFLGTCTLVFSDKEEN